MKLYLPPNSLRSLLSVGASATHGRHQLDHIDIRVGFPGLTRDPSRMRVPFRAFSGTRASVEIGRPVVGGLSCAMAGAMNSVQSAAARTMFRASLIPRLPRPAACCAPEA